MTPLAIRQSDGAPDKTCALCGRAAGPVAGLEIIRLPDLVPVCCECGDREAHPLILLMDFARTAEKIGPMVRRALWLPQETLLKLAHVAEDFACHPSAQTPPAKPGDQAALLAE